MTLTRDPNRARSPRADRFACGWCLISLVVLAGCDEPEVPIDAGLMDSGLDAGGSGTAPCDRDSGLDATFARGLTNTCAQTVLFSGFGIAYTEGALPMARFGVHPQLVDNAPDGCMRTSTLRGATLTALVDGRADEGTVRTAYHVVGAGDPPPVPDAGGGWLGLRVGRESVALTIDDGEATLPVLFDLLGAGMEAALAVAVVLDGFEFDTDVPQAPAFPDYPAQEGYGLRTLGVSIASVSRSGDDLRFEVTGRWEPGVVGEPAMDRAASVATARLIAHYAVVALPADPDIGSVSYHEEHFGHGAEELAVCRPDPAQTELEILGPPAAHAAPAIVSFTIRLFPDAAQDGEFVHELSLLVHDFEHDPGTGRARMQVEGYVSNQGPPQPRRPMDYTVDAEVALLAWDDTGDTDALLWQRVVPGGRSQLMLPLTP